MIKRISSRISLPARLGTAALMAAGLIAGGVAAPASAAQPKEPLEYVALGDSYSAGVGASAEMDYCGRTALGFPALLDESKSIGPVNNVSCAGAETEAIASPQNGVIPPQLTALSGSTDLVTITIGGNDLNYGAVVGACMTAGAATCDKAVGDALAYASTQLFWDLWTGFGDIKTAAPAAHVVVLGYPELFSPQFGRLGPATEAAHQLNEATRALNVIIALAAELRGLQYVDVTQEFQNHGIGSPQPWIHAEGEGIVLHPTAEGYHKGYAHAFKTDVQLNKLQKALAGR